MTWKNKRELYGANKNYSVIRKLRKEGKTTEQFETMVTAVSLEELIALKLELASKSVGGKLYGLPIWYSLPDITKDAVLKYALSAARTKMEAARFLGVNKEYFYRLLKKYNIDSFFEEKQLDKNQA
jgi:transcriptional regulator of acetoin/glycerol metabolism